MASISGEVADPFEPVAKSLGILKLHEAAAHVLAQAADALAGGKKEVTIKLTQ